MEVCISRKIINTDEDAQLLVERRQYVKGLYARR